MVAATTGVTPEREAVHLFTQPYFETCQAALVRVGEGEPTTVAQLAGRRVGASGTGTAFKAMRSVEHATHVTLGKGQAGIPALGERSIDALIFDEFDAVDAARKSGGVLQVLREPIALERYAFVLPKDRIDWKRALDRALDELEQVGTVEELRARFGIARGEAWPIDLGAVR
jgi:ABC-type amino acid transport substrate-binding protein